jgi:hypothetical protein
MFNFNYEKTILDLMQKFGLTRQEAEGFIKQSENLFGLKQLLSDKKIKRILTLIAILLGLLTLTWIYDKLTKTNK